MAIQETVTFTMQQMTVLIEHERVIEKYLTKVQGITLTEFCILRLLELHEGQSVGIDFANFLLLKQVSVNAALSNLEKNGYISKAVVEKDRRSKVVTITPNGIEKAHDATTNIYSFLRQTFWRNFNEDEVIAAVTAGSRILAAIQPEGRSDIENSEHLDIPITAEFIMILKVVPQTWSAEIKKISPLSMSEYRVLALLASSPEGVSATIIASRLSLERSMVSVVKKSLEKKHYIKADISKGDKRIELLSCTEEGEELAQKVTAALTKVTAHLYKNYDAELAAKINEWHMRMYREVGVALSLSKERFV